MSTLVLVCVFGVSLGHSSERFPLSASDRQSIRMRVESLEDFEGMGEALRDTCRDFSGRKADLAYLVGGAT
jgi:hypothetical protein